LRRLVLKLLGRVLLLGRILLARILLVIILRIRVLLVGRLLTGAGLLSGILLVGELLVGVLGRILCVILLIEEMLPLIFLHHLQNLLLAHRMAPQSEVVIGSDHKTRD
jgi:hypothetical protein